MRPSTSPQAQKAALSSQAPNTVCTAAINTSGSPHRNRVKPNPSGPPGNYRTETTAGPWPAGMHINTSLPNRS